VLSGHLVNRVFPGPPDFEDVTRGDVPVTRWYLQLAAPACFSEHRYITQFQLVLGPEEVARYRKFLGKEIEVTGTLAEASGAHRTALVMNVTSLVEVRRHSPGTRPSP
jgi:hypothetical protein